MKTSFWPDIHESFKKYFSIQDAPSKIDQELFEKTYEYIPYIKWIPGIRFIWVGNSTSMFASKETSDIDLFIITAPKRMRLVRIVTTLIFQILWVRKNEKIHEKRFCLSFFVTTDWLDFSSFALENDIYLYFWIIYMKPILDFDHTFERFIQAQSWAELREYKNIIEKNKNFIKFKEKTYGNNCKILDIFDSILEKIFSPKTLQKFKKLRKPYGIIINKNTLKFHDNDKRINIKKELI